LVLAKESDIRWPTLGLKESMNACEIEPGEADEFHFDFVVSSEVEVVEICTYFKNEAKRVRNIGWRHTSLVRLETANLTAQSKAKGGSKDGHEESTTTT
jgi:hypothetical protein